MCWSLDCIGVEEGRLELEDANTFARLATRSPPMAAARFAALVADFGGIARGEATPDVLLAYEM